MVGFMHFVMITLFLADCSADPPPVGIVSKWTPTGSANHDPVWLSTKSLYDRKDRSSNEVEIRCYEYTWGEHDGDMSSRVSLETKADEFEIENFGVKSCTPRILLVKIISTTKTEKGYEYNIVFRDHQGLCYQRKYTTETTEITRTLVRGSEQIIECKTELGFGIYGEKMDIINWSLTGTFDYDFQFSKKEWKTVDRTMTGPCKEIKVHCWQHKNFPSVLIADIEPENDLLLDRVIVTSCSRSSLETSLKCKKYDCKGNNCEFTITFMSADGKCARRKYKSSKIAQKKFGYNIQYEIDKGEVEDLGKWECEDNNSMKGILQSVGKKSGIVRPKKPSE